MLVKDLKVPTVERASALERGADGFAISPATRQRPIAKRVMAGLLPGHDLLLASRPYQ